MANLSSSYVTSNRNFILKLIFADTHVYVGMRKGQKKDQEYRLYSFMYFHRHIIICKWKYRNG